MPTTDAVKPIFMRHRFPPRSLCTDCDISRTADGKRRGQACRRSTASRAMMPRRDRR